MWIIFDICLKINIFIDTKESLNRDEIELQTIKTAGPDFKQAFRKICHPLYTLLFIGPDNASCPAIPA